MSWLQILHPLQICNLLISFSKTVNTHEKGEGMWDLVKLDAEGIVLEVLQNTGKFLRNIDCAMIQGTLLCY